MLNSPFVTIRFCIFQPFTNHMTGCVFDFLSLPNWWKTLIVLHRQCVGHGECCFSYMFDLLYSNINEWRGILNALTVLLGLFVVFLQNVGHMLSAIADHSLFDCPTYFCQHTQYYIGCSTWTSQAQSHNPRCPFDLSIFYLSNHYPLWIHCISYPNKLFNPFFCIRQCWNALPFVWKL